MGVAQYGKDSLIDTVIDPFCGRGIDRNQAAAQIITDVGDFHFCSQNCFDLFQDSPEDYIDLTPVDPNHPDERTYDEGIEWDAAGHGSAGRIVHPALLCPECLIPQAFRAFSLHSVTESITSESKPLLRHHSERCIQRVSCRPLHVRRDVRISVQCHRDVGIPQSFLRDLGMYSLCQHQLLFITPRGDSD